MRRIQKGNEPPSLKAHREGKGFEPTYGNYREKTTAKEAANIEQRYLCAFCQKDTSDLGTGYEKPVPKLAHIVPQKVDGEDGARLQLTWSNLVLSCDGGESTRKPDKLRHCDTLQGNTRLCRELDPVQFVNGSLSYDDDGGIYYSADPDGPVQKQIDDVLGLNIDAIKRNRRSALDKLKAALNESPDRNQTRQEYLDLLHLNQTRGGPLLEYADFLLWYLQNGVWGS